MEKDISVGKIMFLISGSILLLILFFGSFYTVQAGQRGILLTFGNPSELVLGEGLGFKFPVAQKVVKMSIQTQKYESDAGSASKDLQTVKTTIAVNYHLASDMVKDIYTTVGLSYEARLIQPMVQEVVKGSTAEFTAEELITRRPEVKEKIKSLLTERLINRGIIIEDISITNFEFSSSFNEAIESKVTAEQLKLKADRDLERIIIEKEQAITKAQAEAESLRLQKQEVTENLIKLREIEVRREAIAKWDGKLPQVTGGTVPFIDADKRLE